MPARLRAAFAWLLLLALPWQAAAWLRIELRGPAHVHRAAGAVPASALAQTLAGAHASAPARVAASAAAGGRDDAARHRLAHAAGLPHAHPHVGSDAPASAADPVFGTPAVAVGVAPHHHERAERHWHVSVHDDMIVIDVADGDAGHDEVSSAAAGFVAALARSATPAAVAYAPPRPTGPAARWSTRVTPPLERPPRIG